MAHGLLNPVMGSNTREEGELIFPLSLLPVWRELPTTINGKLEIEIA
jgi:hypothetical protein